MRHRYRLTTVRLVHILWGYGTQTHLNSLCTCGYITGVLENQGGGGERKRLRGEGESRVGILTSQKQIFSLFQECAGKTEEGKEIGQVEREGEGGERE